MITVLLLFTHKTQKTGSILRNLRKIEHRYCAVHVLYRLESMFCSLLQSEKYLRQKLRDVLIRYA